VKIQALIPAFQAAGTVGPVVAETITIVRDVLVVDDGSSDDTAGAAAAAGARVLRLPANQGKGAALRAGFEEALTGGAAAVITLDADGQHDPSEISRLIECWQRTGAALVIGSRSHLGGEMSAARRFGNRFARRALSAFAGVMVADSQSGFRLYDASLLKAIPLRGARYELESEVIVKAARAGFGVACTPVRLRRVAGEETSHFRPWRDTARICAAVLKARLG
jgi:glycosyltransferase involved in cell wall biosynthesis